MTPEVEIVNEVAHAAETVEATGGIGSLGLNVKIFIAQLINFAIVVLVLWKWVYKPIVALLEKRQQTIEKSLKEAKEIEEKMQAMDVEREKMINEARKESAGMIEKADDAAKVKSKELLAVAKDDVAKVIAQGKTQLEAEKSKMIDSAKEEIATIAVEAAKKILDGNIDADKSLKLAEGTIKELAD